MYGDRPSVIQSATGIVLRSLFSGSIHGRHENFRPVDRQGADICVGCRTCDPCARTFDDFLHLVGERFLDLKPYSPFCGSREAIDQEVDGVGAEFIDPDERRDFFRRSEIRAGGNIFLDLIANLPELRHRCILMDAKHPIDTPMGHGGEISGRAVRKLRIGHVGGRFVEAANHG